MKANILLNVEVVSQKNGRRHGLVKSLVVVDHVVKYLVINPGGIFSKAQFFKPENIIDVNYKRLIIENEKVIIKDKYEFRQCFNNFTVVFFQIFDMLLLFAL